MDDCKLFVFSFETLNLETFPFSVKVILPQTLGSLFGMSVFKVYDSPALLFSTYTLQ